MCHPSSQKFWTWSQLNRKHSRLKEASTLLPNAFFILISEKSQSQFAFTWEGSQFTFTMLPQGYLSSPAYGHNLVRRDLDLMQVSSIRIQCIYDIMIISEMEEQARTDLNAVVTHTTNRSWLINPAKVHGPAHTVRFLGIRWEGASQDIPQVTKNKHLSLPTPRAKQEAQHLVGLLGFWRTHIPCLGILLAPIYRTT